jgi:hypothetical protein
MTSGARAQRPGCGRAGARHRPADVGNLAVRDALDVHLRRNHGIAPEEPHHAREADGVGSTRRWMVQVIELAPDCAVQRLSLYCISPGTGS